MAAVLYILYWKLLVGMYVLYEVCLPVAAVYFVLLVLVYIFFTYILCLCIYNFFIRIHILKSFAQHPVTPHKIT